MIRKFGDRSHLVFWLGFLIPFHGLSIEYGVLITWAKLIFPIGTIYLVLSYLIRPHTKRFLPEKLYLYSFWIYAIIITTVSSLVNENTNYINNADALSIFQSLLRVPVQFIHFVIGWGLFIIGFYIVVNKDNVFSLIKGYVYGNLINIFFMAYQLIAYYLSLPWLKGYWVMRVEEYNTSWIRMSNIMNIGGINIPRLNGLGGEPKYVGISIAIALFIVLTFFLSQGNKSIFKHTRVYITILTIGLLLTFSVGGLLAILVGLVYLLYSGTRLMRFFKGAKNRYVFMALSVFILIFIIARSSVYTTLYNDYLKVKLNTVEGKGGLASYNDFLLLNILLDSPGDFIFGQGIGYIYTNFGTESESNNALAYVTPRLLLEVGILGIILISIYFLRLARALSLKKMYLESNIILGSFIILMTSGHYIGIYGVMFISGALASSLQQIQLTTSK